MKSQIAIEFLMAKRKFVANCIHSFIFCFSTIGGSTCLAQSNFNCSSLVVLQAAASSSNTTANVLEISKTGTLLQTIAVPSALTLRFSGSATSSMYAATSDDGVNVYFTGAITTATTNVNAILTRGVVQVDGTGSITLPTTYTLPTGTPTQQTRGATTVNGSDFYIGDGSGIYTNAGTAQLNTTNCRAMRSFGGQVYVGRTSTTPAVLEVATVSGLTGTTVTGLAGLPINANTFQDYYLISSGANGSSFDVLYILRASSATVGIIEKFSLVSGSWVSDGTYATGFGGFGLYAEPSATGATLYVTSGSGATTANTLRKLEDAASYNTTINITSATSIYTAAAGTILKGVVSSPKSCTCRIAINPVSIYGLTEQCVDNGWTYYGTSAQNYFAINKNTNTITATVDVETSLTFPSPPSSNGANQQHQMFLMGRFWSVDQTAGSIGASTPASVRFFYHPAELTDAKSARDAAFAALPSGSISVTNGINAEWFKTVNVPLNATYFGNILGNNFPPNTFKFPSTAVSFGTTNGIQYVQLTGITSFSGGGGGFSYGPPNGSGGNALPIRYGSFYGVKNAEGNTLNWSTVSEQNTLYTVVEYSEDGIQYQAASAPILNAGFSQVELAYQYCHQGYYHPVYYRLRHTDAESKCYYSDVIKVGSLEENANTVLTHVSKLYGSSTLQYQLSKIPETNGMISLIDMSGRVILSQVHEAQNSRGIISLSQVSSGMYTLISYIGGTRSSIRFVK